MRNSYAYTWFQARVSIVFFGMPLLASFIVTLANTRKRPPLSSTVAGVYVTLFGGLGIYIYATGDDSMHTRTQTVPAPASMLRLSSLVNFAGFCCRTQ